MANWRDTFKPARFIVLDAKVGVAILVSLLHIRPWTIALALGVTGLFWWLERKGLSFDAALRGARAFLAGKDRPPVKRARLRRRIDHDR